MSIVASYNAVQAARRTPPILFLHIVKICPLKPQ